MNLPAIRLIVLLILLSPLYARAGNSLPDPTDPVAGMGVNIHFTDPKPGELEMLAQAGFRWVRMDFVWQKTEGTKGVYDFSAYERLLASLDKFHLHAVFILDYSNPLYCGNDSPRTPDQQAAYARWAVAAVGHFHDRGVIWEIWNEPNISIFWHPVPNAKEYAQLAVTAARALKNAFPNEIVVGPAMGGVHFDFLETVFQAGPLRYWSAVTIHPYLRTPPETYGTAYAGTAALIQKYAPPGRAIPILCGESGYSTSWVDETTQAQYLARLLLSNVAHHVPLTIWYDWHDDGTDPKNQEHNFGIVNNAYTAGAPQVYQPKPAYLAAQTYSHQLAGLRFFRRVQTDSPDDYILAFTRRLTTSRSRPVCLAAWTTSPTSHQVKIPVIPGIYSVTSYDGKSQPDIDASAGTITLQLDGAPQYLKLK